MPTPSSAQTITPAEAQAIARDAYVYSYAMMESYQTWRAQAVDKTSNGYVGGFNVFRHYSEPFTPGNKDIGLFGSRAQLKTNYLQRDVGAMKGLYGNSLEEAWYGGYVCDGSTPATVHFTKANLPPAKFFWSMTMYTIPDRFLYANPLNRYSIGDRTKGSLTARTARSRSMSATLRPGKTRRATGCPRRRQSAAWSRVSTGRARRQ
jgi:hypothetical protein